MFFADDAEGTHFTRQKANALPAVSADLRSLRNSTGNGKPSTGTKERNKF
jgi:hypothetical protein